MMNLIEKLKIAAGLKVDEKDNSITNNHCEILKDDSIDVVFAKKLIQNNGIFFYCDNKKSLIQTLQALTNKLNSNLIYCAEQILQDLLSQSEIHFNQDNYAECDTIVSSCEYLLAHHGKVMLSSTQLGPHDIKNLPKKHIVLAYTSQIVKNLNEGMSGINNRYMDNLPSTITTIKSSLNENTSDIEGNIKHLSVLLIEDFRKQKNI